MTLDELRQTRKQLVHKKRGIIANNDGCDCLYFPKNAKATVKNFLAERTTALAGTQVGTIAYCSISAGFSNFTHDTKVGTLLAHSPSDFGIAPDKRNIAKDLVDQGTDCLKAVVEFGHKKGMEVFWSMRMNDTHDAAHTPTKPYFLFPPLKVEHPDWLVGDHVKRSPHGRWSSVDYARPEIRDLAFRYIEEVCTNYDVDGVELDFFRHLCYFKSTAFGKAASQRERDLMTGLIRRVREMTEQVGMKRGRPIIVAVRVPDSTGFCKDMGFDIERWLGDGLVDILVTTGYFRLNPWEYSVDLGHKHGVAVYPCLSDSRVRGETRFRRQSLDSYRGRAMEARAAGADGVHLFNYFNPGAPIWRELGDTEKLETLDKLYFVTIRDGNPVSWLARGDRYRTIPVLTPSYPKNLSVAHPLKTGIVIGDDVAKARQAGHEPTITLHVETPRTRGPEQLTVTFNGRRLTEGKAKDGWVDYVLPPDIVKQGVNDVELAVQPLPTRPDEWSIVYEGDKKPGKPWRRDPGSKRTHEKVADGALFIADRGTVAGDYHYYRCPWGADPDGETVVEVRAKVVSGSSYLIVANGISGERLGLWPDHIDLFHHHALRYDMDTTKDFHVYRIVMKGQDLKVFVDGKLRIDGKGTLKPRAMYTRNEVAFGAANSGMVGEAYWDYVKARATGQICQDIVVSVTYGKKKAK